MLVKRLINVPMSDGFWWFLGERKPRPCVVWFLLGVIPVYVDQRMLSTPL